MRVPEKLAELAHVWEDIERTLMRESDALAGALPLAFRVEVIHEPAIFGGPGHTKFVLMFDALDGRARAAADLVVSLRDRIEEEAHRQAQLWVESLRLRGSSDVVVVEKVSPSTPLRGAICNRPGAARDERQPPAAERGTPRAAPDDAELGLTPDVVKRIENGQSTIADVEAANLLVDSLASTMVAVATGGPRIQTKNDEYRREHAALRLVLRRLGISYPNPHNDLWDWYGRWREKLPTYQERRVYISGLFDPVRGALAARAAGHQELETGVLTGSTGWAEVDDMLGKLRRRFREAQDAEDYKAVGLLCHSIMTALGKVVFDPTRDLPAGEESLGPDDAKRQIDLFLRRAATGRRFVNVRKIVTPVYDDANRVKHRHTATKVDAGIAANATLLLAQTLRLIAEEDEEAGNRAQTTTDDDIPF